MFVFSLYIRVRRGTQEMGRLSEDIMALFGTKPSGQQSPVQDSTVSLPSLGVFVN